MRGEVAYIGGVVCQPDVEIAGAALAELWKKKRKVYALRRCGCGQALPPTSEGLIGQLSAGRLVLDQVSLISDRSQTDRPRALYPPSLRYRSVKPRASPRGRRSQRQLRPTEGSCPAFCSWGLAAHVG